MIEVVKLFGDGRPRCTDPENLRSGQVTKVLLAIPPTLTTKLYRPLPHNEKSMEGWSKLQSSIGNINFAEAGSKLTKGFNSSVQATRERFGQVTADEITELPQGNCVLISFQVLSNRLV